MPKPVPRMYVATTSRPHAAVRYALLGWFSDPENRKRTNREAARELQIDEGTVRRYRKEHGIPAMAVGSGLPVPPKPARKRRKPG